MPVAQPPAKRHCQTPTTTMSKPPPQKPRVVDLESSTPTAEGGVQGQEAPSLAICQALEVAILTNMTPIHLNVGASRGFTSAKLRDSVKDHPPMMQPFAPMCAGPI